MVSSNLLQAFAGIGVGGGFELESDLEVSNSHRIQIDDSVPKPIPTKYDCHTGGCVIKHSLPQKLLCWVTSTPWVLISYSVLPWF